MNFRSVVVTLPAESVTTSFSVCRPSAMCGNGSAHFPLPPCGSCSFADWLSNVATTLTGVASSIEPVSLGASRALHRGHARSGRRSASRGRR